MPKVPRSRSSRFARRTSANTLGNIDGSFRSHGTFSLDKIVSTPSQPNASSFQAKRKVSFDVNDCSAVALNPSTYRTSTFQTLPSLEKRTSRKIKRTRTLSRLSRSDCLTMLDIPSKDGATFDHSNTKDDDTATTATVSTLSEDDILSIQSCSCSARLNTAYTSITPASSAAASAPNTTVAASSSTATTTQTLIATPPTAKTNSASGTVTNSGPSPKLPSQDNTTNCANSGWGHFVDVVPEETNHEHVPVTWLPRHDNTFVHRYRPYVATLKPKTIPRARITQASPRWKYTTISTNDISDAMNSISL